MPLRRIALEGVGENGGVSDFVGVAGNVKLGFRVVFRRNDWINSAGKRNGCLKTVRG